VAHYDVQVADPDGAGRLHVVAVADREHLRARYAHESRDKADAYGHHRVA
jgi:hypothetical protein